jgi:hypothetical protein
VKRLSRVDHAKMTPEESAKASHEARLRAKRAYRARNVEKCRAAWRAWYKRKQEEKKGKK